jgi:hypothetical protein
LHKSVVPISTDLVHCSPELHFRRLIVIVGDGQSQFERITRKSDQRTMLGKHGLGRQRIVTFSGNQFDGRLETTLIRFPDRIQTKGRTPGMLSLMRGWGREARRDSEACHDDPSGHSDEHATAVEWIEHRWTLAQVKRYATQCRPVAVRTKGGSVRRLYDMRALETVVVYVMECQDRHRIGAVRDRR